MATKPIAIDDPKQGTTSRHNDWTKPAAMAIPKEGFFKDKIEQGRYGPIFPQTPACYGFSSSRRSSPEGRAPIRLCQDHRESDRR